MSHPKRFKLTQDMIDSFYTEDGQYKFRSGFSKDDGKTICGPRLCAIITIQDTDIVQTTNHYAQDYLAKAMIPQGVKRNGVAPPPGPVWLDVTATEPVANVDLDPYFV